jgi:hypothetical protein
MAGSGTFAIWARSTTARSPRWLCRLESIDAGSRRQLPLALFPADRAIPAQAATKDALDRSLATLPPYKAAVFGFRTAWWYDGFGATYGRLRDDLICTSFERHPPNDAVRPRRYDHNEGTVPPAFRPSARSA